jgi:hypothetical protein
MCHFYKLVLLVAVVIRYYVSESATLTKISVGISLWSVKFVNVS